MKFVEPRFPRVALLFEQSAVVVLEGLITTEGAITDLEVIQPRGFGFEEAAIEAVSQWRFRPLIADGKPEEARITVTVRFTPEPGR